MIMITISLVFSLISQDIDYFEGRGQNRKTGGSDTVIQYHEKTDHYEFRARDWVAIQKKIKKLGPKKGHKRFDAAMKHKITWVLDYTSSSGRCHVKDASVVLNVTFIMPHWKNQKKAPENLQEQWKTYYEKLKTHEAIHADLAYKTAEEVRRTLLSIKASQKCSQLETKAKRLVKKILASGEKLQLRYDKITQHGQTQERYKNNLKF